MTRPGDKVIADLSRESLRLAICGVCKALTLTEDFSEHWSYHRSRGDLDE
jgi:hypothetical protein